MLFGHSPFNGKDTNNIILNIKSHELNYDDTNKKISNSCKDLIQKLLNMNPQKRLKIKDILEHPFIKKHSKKFLSNKQLTNSINEDIIQSQNNKKPMRHYVTKKKQINSKNKNINNNQNIDSFNIINKNIAKTNLENTKKNDKNFLGLPQPYKKKEISQSRNLANNKKPLIKNDIKNVQLNNNNKKINLIPPEEKQFINLNTHNKIIPPTNKNLNNNIINKKTEKMYGTVIDDSKKNNNNNQNTQTVQNIILKSNINISFINNFNTTYLHKSKKKQKKIRSRNNQELSKLNMIGNKFININNHIEVEEDFNNNNKIFKNKNNDAETKMSKKMTNKEKLRKEAYLNDNNFLNYGDIKNKRLYDQYYQAINEDGYNEESEEVEEEQKSKKIKGRNKKNIKETNTNVISTREEMNVVEDIKEKKSGKKKKDKKMSKYLLSFYLKFLLLNFH